MCLSSIKSTKAARPRRLNQTNPGQTILKTPRLEIKNWYPVSSMTASAYLQDRDFRRRAGDEGRRLLILGVQCEGFRIIYKHHLFSTGLHQKALFTSKNNVINFEFTDTNRKCFTFEQTKTTIRCSILNLI